MSGSESNSLSRIPSPTRIRAEHHITLTDRTLSKTPSYIDRSAEQSDSDHAAATPATQDTPGLYHRMTNNSLRQTVRQEYSKQKYAKYSQDRYHVRDSETLPDENTVNVSQPGQEATAAQKGYLERAQTKAKALLKRKKTLGKGDAEDMVIDVLYENQRGIFFFGIPKYSSASLLPSDPKPWQNGQFRTSAVDIRNGQVPDPSWEWVWKSWYVDMSRDVDEEGWEYSFAFVGKGGATFAWHGTHPWFHSFVRRRRWLRLRRRKDRKHHTREKGHELTADYFTIHPKTVRPASLHSTQVGTSTLAHALTLKEPVLDVEKMDISSIGDLFLAMKKSNVDREKILAVRKFLDEGGDELYYLSERMGDIMGMLMFQSSRRQLLGDLTSRHEQAHATQDDLTTHQHGEEEDAKRQEHEKAMQRAENLLKAVHAADEQVKKLEYWSDIKGFGITASPAGKKEESHNEPSFKNKQKPDEAIQPLKAHPEQISKDKGKGYETAYDTASEAPSKKSSKWFDSESKISKSKPNDLDDDALERYTTASESSMDFEGKKQEKQTRKASGR